MAPRSREYERSKVSPHGSHHLLALDERRRPPRNTLRWRPSSSYRSDVLASAATLGGVAWGPDWNPDGRRITFSSNRAGRWHFYEITASDRDQPEILLYREKE